MTDIKKEILAYPLNEASFDNVYYDATDAQTYTCTRTTGVYSADDNMRVVAVGGRNVTVMEGLAWLNFDKFRGIATANTVEKNGVITFNIVPAIALPRIDRIIISYDFNDDQVDILIRQGTAASNPQAPAIRRDGSYYEIALADIYVSVGSGNIVQGNIADQRLNEAICGIMRDGVTGIPTQDLYNQFAYWFNDTKNNFDSWFLQFKNDNQTNFDNWFNMIKKELEGFDPTIIIARLDAIEDGYQRPQITEIDGRVKNYMTSGSITDNLVNMGTGLHTFYAGAATTNRPPDSTSYRGLAHITDTTNYGYSLAFSEKNKAYYNCYNDNNWNGWQQIATVFSKNFDNWTQLPIAAGWDNAGGALTGIKYTVNNNIMHVVYYLSFNGQGDLTLVYLPEEVTPEFFVMGMCWVLDPIGGGGGVGAVGVQGNSITYFFNVSGEGIGAGKRIAGYVSYPLKS